ncbi:LytTR family DNA-binding domain-containing protein [Paenibacillus elgii]|uniref:LytTR family DNA-binding domain-containing protein n=1 Tax=Paenibacillus elgii TaxID=189691 RepID=UPI000248C376|nr:LytTR family DNA-binding domain-containing protein [Paenibacillus elgii]
MNIQLSQNRLIIVKRNQIMYISLSDIIFIERIRQKTLIHTDAQEIIVYISLKDLMRILPDIFIRSHKSFIINVQNLKELNLFNRNTFEAYYKNRKTALVSKQVLRQSIYSTWRGKDEYYRSTD